MQEDTQDSADEHYANELSKVHNPLFRFKKRPEVLDIMYADCMSSFVRDKKDRAELNIFQTRYEELADLTEPVSDREATSFLVKAIHEQIGITGELPIISKKDQPQDKETILDALKEIAASGSGFARYSAPAHIDIGIGIVSTFKRQLKQGLRVEDLAKDNVVSNESKASDQLNDMKRDYKDMHCKRLLLDVFEAATM